MRTCPRHLKHSSIVICLTFSVVVHCSSVGHHSTEAKRSSKQLDNEDNGDSLLALYSMFGGGNPSKTPDGQRIVEGDIVVPDSDDTPSQRKATPDTSVYWPNGEVVYTYHESINPAEMAVIEAAMQHWRQHTCITFRPRQPNDYIFVRFRSDMQGCWSLVGRQADRIGMGQDVSIGQGCANLNVVVHEIGHVIGFYHEQSRSDRDQYIDIQWANVLPGYALQFRKESDSNFNIPYDLTSTMQYPQWAFSREIFEKSTIVAKNPAYQRFLSKNYPLSFRDRQLANQLYSCTNSCYGSCQNGGYMRAMGASYGAASSCTCDCPPNYTGDQCEIQIRSDYYEELPCGGLITKEGLIETPNYPQRSQPFQSCMWDIRAPAGKRVSLKFNGFEFAPRFTKVGTKVINKCFNETIEIRLKSANIHDGDSYCGSDIAPGTVLKSDGPRAVIIITANDKMIGKGLSARVRFVRAGPPLVGGGDDQDDDDEADEGKEEDRPPGTPPPLPTIAPPVTLPVVATRPPIAPPVASTLPPIVPPPSVVTGSSLLEEYEKESKKTLPPVIPIFGH